MGNSKEKMAMGEYHTQEIFDELLLTTQMARKMFCKSDAKSSLTLQ